MLTQVMNESPLPHLTGSKGLPNPKQSNKNYWLLYSITSLVFGIIRLDSTAGNIHGGNFGVTLYRGGTALIALICAVAFFVTWLKQRKENAG